MPSSHSIRWIAVVVLLMSPAASQGQTIEEFLKAREKAGPVSSKTADDLMDWAAFNRAGWRAMGKGWFDTAEHEFLSAIKAAQRPGINDQRLVARSYADFAWALQKQNRNADAEPLVKWALTVREANLPADSVAIAQTLNQLATLYSETKRPAEAEPLLRRAIDQQGKSARPDFLELARSQTLLGLLMVSQQRYSEAEAPFLAAIRLREKKQGSSDPETGDAVNNLARTFQVQRKFDKARPLFERALTILEQTRGAEDPSIAPALDALAQIDETRGDLEEAEAKYQRAIGIWDGYAPEGAKLKGEVVEHYAGLLERSGRTADAQKLRARPKAPPTGPSPAEPAPVAGRPALPG